MKILLAVEKLKYIKPEPVVIRHSRVVELHPERTAEIVAYNKKIHQGVRNGILSKNAIPEGKEFKCLDCGTIWRENIHAPLIVTAEDVNTYYKDSKPCSILK